MDRKCPHCGKTISYLEVSRQIEGSINLPDVEKSQLKFKGFDTYSITEYPIEWKPDNEQDDPIRYNCPECLEEITDETLRDWGFWSFYQLRFKR